MPTRRLVSAPDKAPVKKDSSARSQSHIKSRSSLSSHSIDNARFVPGTILAERYRIVGLLGRGGMGEVYRADDLKLSQPVALKFLPEGLSTDGATLARFHREVRVARQVSHRNVCRVYDIGEVDGQQFLSMEYIKGEELSSLLRRIGRLPADKAIEISRQLCAGLSAAHENGVLHRDLKPANVMIDGDGNVRILDFGLAGLTEEFGDDEMRAGTPAYMAPEQLNGEELTTRSDIYSLGLVLYEIFTGKRAFEASSLLELVELRKTGTMPTNPTSHVKDIDPLVERVILRCLEKDPKERPASALQVAAALPGGDPLAAALAAGETPSPEMVAAAPKEGALRPPVAVALLASVLVMLVIGSLLSSQTALYRMVPLEKSPEVLKERAREVAKKLGYVDAPADSAYGLYPDRDYLQYVVEHDQSRSRWDKLRTGQPPAIYFWYRQSPRYLVASGSNSITSYDPPQIVSGMINIYLDTQGSLRLLSVVPPQKEASPPPQRQEERPSAPNWSALFAEAGLDQASFQEVASIWSPPHAYDARAAWDGTYPANPDVKLHIEAASYRGRPVYFEIVNPWDRPARQEQRQETTSDKILTIIIFSIFMIALVGSALLALRSLRLGRGDRRGAFRLAIFFFTLRMLVWLFDAHHVWTAEEILLFLEHVKSALFQASFLWLMYIALEPSVRRRWPEGIIGWNRLLAGGFRDPLVGRDVLIGALFGTAIILSNYCIDLIPKWFGMPPSKPFWDNLHLLGIRYSMTSLAQLFFSSLFLGFVYLFLLVLLYMILRRKWLAAIFVWLTHFSAISLGTSDRPSVRLIFVLTSTLLYVTCMYRYGLLASIAALFFFHAWVFLPITTELSAWYAGDYVLALIVYIALAFYGFYTSLAGQPLFRNGFLQD